MYIDGVFSGGGVRGYALVGAYQTLEKNGFVFKRLAGTSAGALIAALISAGYKGEELCQLLKQLNLSEFLDERRTFIQFPLAKWLLLYWRMGLYKGDQLEKWVNHHLATKGVRTFGDLPPGSLKIVASDLTNGRILILPDDLKLYGIDPSSFPVAKAVRMSCGLPYFFEPVKLRTKKGSCYIVDGGVLSNFPIWLFDQDETKKVRPVIGVKLSPKTSERPKKKIANAFALFEALFQTMKEAHDSRYISRKHEKNIIFIPTANLIATDFHITEEQKEALIELGKKKAEAFLMKWSY
jgi:NTE family protein